MKDGKSVENRHRVGTRLVLAYEVTEKMNVRPSEEAIATFEASYMFEMQHGHSHFVGGRLASRASEMGAILSAVVAELPSP